MQTESLDPSRFRDFFWQDTLGQRKGGDRVASKNGTIPKAVIATRKTCKATGTGLSHYVMLDANTTKKQ